MSDSNSSDEELTLLRKLESIREKKRIQHKVTKQAVPSDLPAERDLSSNAIIHENERQSGVEKKKRITLQEHETKKMKRTREVEDKGGEPDAENSRHNKSNHIGSERRFVDKSQDAKSRKEVRKPEESLQNDYLHVQDKSSNKEERRRLKSEATRKKDVKTDNINTTRVEVDTMRQESNHESYQHEYKIKRIEYNRGPEIQAKQKEPEHEIKAKVPRQAVADAQNIKLTESQRPLESELSSRVYKAKSPVAGPSCYHEEHIEESEYALKNYKSANRRDEHIESKTSASESVAHNDLDEEMLLALAPFQNHNHEYGEDIDERILKFHQPILMKRMSLDYEYLSNEYKVPNNCRLLYAPDLNIEIKKSVPMWILNRDDGMRIQQQQIGTSITAIFKAMRTLLNNKENVAAIKHLKNGCLILSNLHASFSINRTKLIEKQVKEDEALRVAIQKSERGDTLLLGSNFPDLLATERRNIGYSNKPKNRYSASDVRSSRVGMRGFGQHPKTSTRSRQSIQSPMGENYHWRAERRSPY